MHQGEVILLLPTLLLLQQHRTHRFFYVISHARSFLRTQVDPKSSSHEASRHALFSLQLAPSAQASVATATRYRVRGGLRGLVRETNVETLRHALKATLAAVARSSSDRLRAGPHCRTGAARYQIVGLSRSVAIRPTSVVCSACACRPASLAKGKLTRRAGRQNPTP